MTNLKDLTNTQTTANLQTTPNSATFVSLFVYPNSNVCYIPQMPPYQSSSQIQNGIPQVCKSNQSSRAMTFQQSSLREQTDINGGLTSTQMH